MDEPSNAQDDAKTEIEELRLFAQTARIEIEGQLSAATEAVANLQQQFESAKSAIADVVGLQRSAQETSTQAAETKAQAAAALQLLQDGANRVEAIKTSAEQTQSVISTKSQHIEDARIHADKVRSELDRMCTEAQQSATNSEAQHQASRAASEALNNLFTLAQTVKANTDSNAETVVKLRQQCEEHAATAKKLADIADTTEKSVSAYEARLAELEKTAAERLKTIEGLLPGATSAGLASAFNQRCAHFKWPQRFWQTVFLIAVLALLGLAWLEFSLVADPEGALTLGGLGISLLHRLPFALPLIWLAIHASHKAALAQRVEEDYAFKETVSRSFEGYRREMAELEGTAAPQSALSRYCEGVLSVITNPPGRIYEKHGLNHTPLNAIAESAGPIAEAASKMTKASIQLEGPALSPPT